MKERKEGRKERRREGKEEGAVYFFEGQKKRSHTMKEGKERREGGRTDERTAGKGFIKDRRKEAIQ